MDIHLFEKDFDEHQTKLVSFMTSISKFCKPDNVDQTIHRNILEYAYCKTGNIPENWTLSRMRYFKDDGKEIRSYAFSASNKKTFHNV